MTDLDFRKSTYSGNRQDCVEVARHPKVGVALRDTQNRAAGHLSFPTAEWRAFLADVQAGEL